MAVILQITFPNAFSSVKFDLNFTDFCSSGPDGQKASIGSDNASIMWQPITRQFSNIRRTQSQNINVSHLVL